MSDVKSSCVEDVGTCRQTGGNSTRIYEDKKQTSQVSISVMTDFCAVFILPNNRVKQVFANYSYAIYVIFMCTHSRESGLHVWADRILDL